jgi:hypothetical protein
MASLMIGIVSSFHDDVFFNSPSPFFLTFEFLQIVLSDEELLPNNKEPQGFRESCVVSIALGVAPL